MRSRRAEIGLVEDPGWGAAGGGRLVAQRGFVRAFADALADGDRGWILADSPGAQRWLATVLSPAQRDRLVRPRGNGLANANVVQCLGEANVTLQRACLRAGRVPIAYATHGFPTDARLDGGQAAAMLLAGMARHDAVVCSSTAMQCAWTHLFGMFDPSRYPPPLLPFIPWGIDTDALWPEDAATCKRRLGLVPERLSIGFVGRLSLASKADLLPLLRAVSLLELPEPPVLVIAGPEIDAGYVESLESFAAALSLPPPHFVGPVAPQDRRIAFGAMDIVVCLSDLLGEGQGLTPLEAMACGRPVVASDWAGYRDGVLDGHTGISIPTFAAACSDELVDGSSDRDAVLSQAVVTDLPALIRGLDRLARSADLRTRMGEAGRARVVARYAWPSVLAEYRALWSEQLAIRKASEFAAPRTEGLLGAQASVSLEALLQARVRLTALGRATDRVIPVHARIDAHLDLGRIDALLDALAEGPRPLRRLVDPDDAAGLRHALFLAKHGFVDLLP